MSEPPSAIKPDNLLRAETLSAGTRVFPLRLPRSTRKQATEFAHAQGVSVNEFISNAVGEKIGRVERVLTNHERLRQADKR